MISLYAAMLVTLGFLIAALLVVVLLPAYRHRIERFTSEELKRTLPLTESEIRADKDRLRADFALEVHKLETKLEDATLSAARQNVEISRRDAKVQELTLAIADHKMSVEEHENARRVLEQAILDRLPKVEGRLAETRKLLSARDREIADLLNTSAKQSSALEQATQLNAQHERELQQLRTAVETRAARNREAVADNRFDAEVAMKTEIEELRARAREQSVMIESLQTKARAQADRVSEADAEAAEMDRLKAALARAEQQLEATRVADDVDLATTANLQDRVRDLESQIKSAGIETAKLRAALKAFEEPDGKSPSITQDAAVGALQAEIDEQRQLIDSLQAEIAEGQERLLRQAQHFSEELRRHRTEPSGEAAAAAEASRRTLAERISGGPRHQRETSEAGRALPVEPPVASRPAAYLRTVNGEEAPAPTADDGKAPPPLPVAEDVQAPRQARRPRLLERISGLEKG